MKFKKTHITSKTILLVALPIILESFAQNILNVTDTAFMGRVGPVSLGAAAVGSIFYFIFISLAFGLSIGTQIIIARRFGEQNFRMIGRTLMQTQYTLLFLGLFLSITLSILLPYIIPLIVESPNVREQTNEYLKYRIFGFIPAFLNSSFRALYVGVARTKIITVATIIMTIVNIVLNYLLIFGNYGFPEMGIAGAAIGSVIAETVAFLVFVFFTVFKLDKKKFRLFLFTGLNFHLIKRILKIALPLMSKYFISFVCWFAFFIMIEKIGEIELAISNIIRSIYVVMLLPIWGFAAATNTFVSQLIGQNRNDEVFSLTLKSLKLCLIFTISFVLILSFFPETFISVITNDPKLAALSKPLYYLVLGAAPILAAGIIFFSAVTGSGKTYIALFIEVFVLTIYMIFSWIVIYVFEWPILLVWTVEYFYGILLLVVAYFYIKYGNWEKTNV